MYLGNQPALSYTSFAKQDFTTSATTSYTLDNPVTNANELALFINFVRQEPTTAYTASGTTLTLTSATSASDDMYCVFLGKAVQTVNSPSGSVGISQLSATGTKDATTFLRGDNSFAVPTGNGKVLQAVSSSYTGAAESTTSNTFQASSLFVNITPSATTSKILVLACGNAGTSGNATSNRITLYRDSTNLGDSTHGINQVYSSGGSVYAPFNINLLDSPSTTSQITYKIYWKAFSGAHAQYLHTDGLDSFITALEIGAW